MLTKKEVKKIKKIKGKVRGVVFQTDLQYIKERTNKKKVESIKEGIKELDPTFDPEEIRNTGWYPLRWRIFMLLAVRDVCGWGEKNVYEMGRQAPQNSFLVKIILRYFLDFKNTCQEASTYWQKHYSRGDFETVEFNESEKYVIFHLRNFKIHPALCSYFMGYFQGMAELTNPSEDIKTEETKCVFNGNKYHEFIIKWS